MSERKDSWTENDDNVLADTIIEYICSGKTQLQAFEAVGVALNRTPAACGFRWNSEVRSRYQEEIASAKKKKREIKSKQNETQLVPVSLKSLRDNTRNELISQIQFAVSRIEEDIKALKHELAKRTNEIEQIKSKIEIIMTPEEKNAEDYRNLIQILNRARSMSDKIS